jgi:GTP-binding protein
LLPKQVSAPAVNRDAPLQMLVTNLDYDEHKGRIAIGRVTSGIMQKAEAVAIGRPGGPSVFVLSGCAG